MRACDRLLSLQPIYLCCTSETAVRDVVIPHTHVRGTLSSRSCSFDNRFKFSPLNYILLLGTDLLEIRVGTLLQC